MGPRPCSRGNALILGTLLAAWRCFNGATALQPWKLLVGIVVPRPILASMGPRPCSRGNLDPSAGRSGPRDPASMGPRPCSRGNKRSDVCRELAGHASMGPRPCSRGNRQPHHELPDGVAASMGPRPCSRGNTAWRPVTSTVTWLQWGHGLAAVETIGYANMGESTMPGFNGATALQPWKQPLAMMGH